MVGTAVVALVAVVGMTVAAVEAAMAELAASAVHDQVDGALCKGRSGRNGENLLRNEEPFHFAAWRRMGWNDAGTRGSSIHYFEGVEIDNIIDFILMIG